MKRWTWGIGLLWLLCTGVVAPFSVPAEPRRIKGGIHVCPLDKSRRVSKPG